MYDSSYHFLDFIVCRNRSYRVFGRRVCRYSWRVLLDESFIQKILSTDQHNPLVIAKLLRLDPTGRLAAPNAFWSLLLQARSDAKVELTVEDLSGRMGRSIGTILEKRIIFRLCQSVPCWESL